MDLSKVNALFIFRPLPTYRTHDQILNRCKKLKKEYFGTPANRHWAGSIPQIREYWEEFQDQLDQKGKWWRGGTWSRYSITFADLEKAVREREFELLFYRNLLIIKFAPQASTALKELLLHKALESELEVVPE
jgi:hypothetical protein